MLRLSIGAFCIALCLAVNADSEFLEGQHYERITPEVATHTDGKIEVVEVFWYGCSHCFAFEPHLQEWLESKPENVEFRRSPGVFAQNWIPHARAFFAAEALGVSDTIHVPLFEAIHVEGRKIIDEDGLAKFFVEHGVSDEDFREAYNSFSVDSKARQAMTATRDYGITGVPSVIIDGRFRTSARLTGTYEDLLKVVEHLVDKQAKQ